MRKDKIAYNEYMKSYMLAKYHTRRNAAIERFGGKCSHCASSDELEFDHIDPRDKKFSVSKIWSLKDSVYLTELDKCQLLCRQCHLTKTLAEGSLDDKTCDIICNCGKMYHSTKQYAGHKTWCKF